LSRARPEKFSQNFPQLPPNLHCVLIIKYVCSLTGGEL
jgi:hypothetical protein